MLTTQEFKKEQEKLIAENQSKEKIIENKSEELIRTQYELKLMQHQAPTLEKELAAAQDKISALRQDNLFLTQEKSHLAGQCQQLEK